MERALPRLAIAALVALAALAPAAAVPPQGVPASDTAFAAAARGVPRGGRLRVTGYRLEGETADVDLDLERVDVWAANARVELRGGQLRRIPFGRWPSSHGPLDDSCQPCFAVAGTCAGLLTCRGAKAAGAAPRQAQAPASRAPPPSADFAPRLLSAGAPGEAPMIRGPPSTVYLRGGVAGEPGSVAILSVRGSGEVQGMAAARGRWASPAPAPAGCAPKRRAPTSSPSRCSSVVTTMTEGWMCLLGKASPGAALAWVPTANCCRCAAGQGIARGWGCLFCVKGSGKQGRAGRWAAACGRGC